MNLKKKWNKLTTGWFGTVIYIFLGFLLAFGLMQVLGLAFNSDTPVVAVVSCSMEQNVNPLCEYGLSSSPKDVICGNKVTAYDNSFDDYWNICGDWYASKGITKSNFMDYISSNGLEIGEILFIINNNEFEVGDVIVYHGREAYPIIHRIVEINEKGIMTKGDRNPTSDPGYISESSIYGKVIFKFPLLGWVKIAFTEITGIA